MSEPKNQNRYDVLKDAEREAEAERQAVQARLRAEAQRRADDDAHEQNSERFHRFQKNQVAKHELRPQEALNNAMRFQTDDKYRVRQIEKMDGVNFEKPKASVQEKTERKAAAPEMTNEDARSERLRRLKAFQAELEQDGNERERPERGPTGRSR